MEKSREQCCNLYIAFIDFTKAFDTVNRPLLFKLLSKIGCPPNLLKTIQLLYLDRLRWLGHIARMYNSRTVKNSSMVSLFWAVDRLGVHAYVTKTTSKLYSRLVTSYNRGMSQF